MDGELTAEQIDEVLGEVRALPANERGKELLKRGLSTLHEALADYLLMNPGATLREMGAHFGYSVAWLCTVTNSDMFVAYMAQRRDRVATLVEQSLPKKLEAAAHLATERIIKLMTDTEDPDLILDGFDKIMHRAGYAPSAKQAQVVAQQNNVFFLNKDELTAAREKLVGAHAAKEPESNAPAIDSTAERIALPGA